MLPCGAALKEEPERDFMAQRRGRTATGQGETRRNSTLRKDSNIIEAGRYCEAAGSSWGKAKKLDKYRLRKAQSEMERAAQSQRAQRRKSKREERTGQSRRKDVYVGASQKCSRAGAREAHWYPRGGHSSPERSSS